MALDLYHRGLYHRLRRAHLASLYPRFPWSDSLKEFSDAIDQTTFLSAEEKKLVASRLAVDNMGDIGRMDVMDRKSMKRAFSDYKIYVG